MTVPMSDASTPPPHATTPLPSPEQLVRSVQARLNHLDPQIGAALVDVPRAHFLPGIPLEQVYSDTAIPIKKAFDGTVTSSASQPSMMTIMLEQLDLRPGDNILEVGAGSGYNAAIMQYLVGHQGHVTSIELDQEVAENARNNLQRAAMTSVNVVTGDGLHGYAPRAAYDRILATAAIWDIPRAWLRQLRPNGRLVAPVYVEGFQMSGAFVAQRDGTMLSTANSVCLFVWMQGQRTSSTAGFGAGFSIPVQGGLFLDAIAPMDSTAVAHLLGDDAETGYFDSPTQWADLWQGFLPWLAIHRPHEIQLAGFRCDGHVYGLEGAGFALFSPGSACFVQLADPPVVRYFGAADTYLTLHDMLKAWESAGRPGQEQIRLRFIPIEAQPAGTGDLGGKTYRRIDHLLHIWMEE
ncbi:MAG: methyltransferase domain-containing protein [Chloroflexi bacterium]|nr:methyltransferase domain-containing protein [Chloroflexota bacterium]